MYSGVIVLILLVLARSEDAAANSAAEANSAQHQGMIKDKGGQENKKALSFRLVQWAGLVGWTSDEWT